jgi:DNA polymerase-1
MILVDGSNHAFRVHFALPPMHASDGFPTRALYGFTTMMARLERAWKPDYVAFCFDIGKTFRHHEFPAYKGHRPDMPADLRQQWPHFQALIEGFGYQYLAVEGFEADDVIGTLAKQYASPELEVLMVTGDKDYCQLVDDNIRIVDLMKDAVLGPDDVPDKFGVTPDKVADVLGLAGDSSDNIPGVPGIGVKTAAKLIAEFGSLEGVLEAAPGIKGKRGENLRNHAEDARISRWLATIKLDVPLGLSLDDLLPKGLQTEALGELFEKWNFGKVARRLLGKKAAVDLTGFETLTSAEQLVALAKKYPIAGLGSDRYGNDFTESFGSFLGGYEFCVVQWSNGIRSAWP